MLGCRGCRHAVSHLLNVFDRDKRLVATGVHHGILYDFVFGAESERKSVMRTERQIAGTGNVERVIAHLPRRLVEALVNRLLNAFLSVYDHGHLIGLRQLVVL